MDTPSNVVPMTYTYTDMQPIGMHMHNVTNHKYNVTIAIATYLKSTSPDDLLYDPFGKLCIILRDVDLTIASNTVFVISYIMPIGCMSVCTGHGNHI